MRDVAPQSVRPRRACERREERGERRGERREERREERTLVIERVGTTVVDESGVSVKTAGVASHCW